MFIDISTIYCETSDNYYWVTNNIDWDSNMFPFYKPNHFLDDKDYWLAIYKSIEFNNCKVVYLNKFIFNNVQSIDASN